MAANDNDDFDGKNLGGRRPPKPSAAVPNEDRILAEGKKARIAAGIALAKVAKVNPTILDGKKLARIGDDGRAAFIGELRADLPAIPVREKAASASSSRSTKTKKAPVAKTVPPKQATSAPLSQVEGWWHHRPRISPSSASFVWGYGIGGVVLAGFIIVFRTMPY